MKRHLFAVVMGIAILLAGAPLTVVHSQTSLSSDINAQLGAAGAPSGLGNSDPRLVAAKIIVAALGMLGTVFLALIVYAGYLWVTSAGEEEPIIKAKMIIRNSIIGLAIVLMSYGITVFVFNGLVYSNYVTKPTGPSSLLPGFQFKVLP